MWCRAGVPVGCRGVGCSNLAGLSSCHSLGISRLYFSSPPLPTPPFTPFPFFCHCFTNIFSPKDPEHLEMIQSFFTLPL